MKTDMEDGDLFRWEAYGLSVGGDGAVKLSDTASLRGGGAWAIPVYITAVTFRMRCTGILPWSGDTRMPRLSVLKLKG